MGGEAVTHPIAEHINRLVLADLMEQLKQQEQAAIARLPEAVRALLEVEG
jgi:hypothetical protein